MKKRTSLGFTDIEYGINKDGSRGRSYNIYPGCLHKPQGKCPLPTCWAEIMWKRRMGAAAKKGITLPDFHQPHLIPELLLAPLRVKKPQVILVNFMGDLFGDWVDPEQVVTLDKRLKSEPSGPGMWYTPLRGWVKFICEQCPKHTFLFLTKNPAGYARWSKEWPENTWLGASVWNEETMIKALYDLTEVKAGGRWLSIEPMLGSVVPAVWPAEWDEIGWVVIGAQSQPTLYPQVDWVENIVTACLDAHIPVWLKSNLQKSLPPAPPFYIPPVLPAKTGTPMTYRQERPF